MDGRRQWNVETKALMADKFYFVAVEYLVKTDCGFHYPAELGWVEYSILEGISHFDNYFIPDVKIPDGSLADAQIHCLATHRLSPILPHRPEVQTTTPSQILEDFRLYCGFFRCPEMRPKLYCHYNQLQPVRDAFKYLKQVAGESDYSFPCDSDIFSVEDLLRDLIRRQMGGKTIYESEAKDKMRKSVFDYAKFTRCPYHLDVDVIFCAIATAKRIGYCISMVLKEYFPVDITTHHVPEQRFLSYNGDIFRTQLED